MRSEVWYGHPWAQGTASANDHDSTTKKEPAL